MEPLQIAQIPYQSGQVQMRYFRYLAEDGTKWIRHGLFRAYHEDGTLASEGEYDHGKESGLWRDFHPNGQLAAEGHYDNGVEVGPWRYWDAAGNPESK
jgi:antitoxin component YwqK of YwqJK toxin-antitoxin module